MSISYPNILLTATWINLVTATPALSGKALTLQNVAANDTVQIYFGGATAPAVEAGVQLGTGEAVDGSSDSIWAKSGGGRGVLVVLEN